MPIGRSVVAHRRSSVLVDGALGADTVSMRDLTFIRGDGAFEVVSLLPAPGNAAVGVPVGMQLHLDRLESTCLSLRLPLPHPVGRIAEWLRDAGKANGPGSCRVVITRGQPAAGVDSKCFVMHEQPATYSAALRLKTMAAPWHFGYSLSPLADPPPYSQKVDIDSWKTVKWMSYAPNCLMTRVAQEQGADDALLLAADGRVLDGPNFAVGFVVEQSLRLVAAGPNRMLPSCTQAMVVRAAEAAGMKVLEGIVHLDDARAASAAFAMSATRHVLPITAIDDHELHTEDPVLRDVQAAYWRYLDAELRAS